MKILTEQHPDTDYYFIIGADRKNSSAWWYRIDELVDMVQFVGFSVHATRQGLPIRYLGGRTIMDISRPAWCGISLPKLSETHFLLPQSVLDYNEKEGSYHGLIRLYQLLS